MDKDGNLIELMCYLFGDSSCDENNQSEDQVVDCILYPKQISTASKVDDDGK